MPNRNLPFKSYITEDIENPLTLRTINEAKMNHFSIVPQARFYFGDRETFTRFYFSPYLRYARYHSDFAMHFEERQMDNSIVQVSIPSKANINTYSVGYAFGVQFNVYRSFFVDWKIFGNHYGITRGQAVGYSDYHIPASIKDDINQDLESLKDIPVYSVDYQVDDRRVLIKPSGINIGFVTGLSVGYKF